MTTQKLVGLIWMLNAILLMAMAWHFGQEEQAFAAITLACLGTILLILGGWGMVPGEPETNGQKERSLK